VADDFAQVSKMGSMYELSPHPVWVNTMHRYLQPYWDGLLNGDFVESAAATRLSVEELRGWILHMYPFIHTFPKFLAEALIKVEDDASRSFLIDNIRVEKAHAQHWLWMADGFGIPRQEMLGAASGDAPVLRDVQSLTDWLWYINTKGSLAEAVAATSFAIEGVTGDLTRKTLQGFTAYGNFPGVTMDQRTSRWMRSHARYDDEHPKVALEVMKRYATTDRLQQRCMLAAKRSLQLLDLAMSTSYRAYSEAQAADVGVGSDTRAAERRRWKQPIGFPERRFGDRRGRRVRPVA
jgi:pyrroloquinoline quinone (PQQ) biosynthesis protein C